LSITVIVFLWIRFNNMTENLNTWESPSEMTDIYAAKGDQKHWNRHIPRFKRMHDIYSQRARDARRRGDTGSAAYWATQAIEVGAIIVAIISGRMVALGMIP
jgi:hypothetical protein